MSSKYPHWVPLMPRAALLIAALTTITVVTPPAHADVECPLTTRAWLERCRDRSGLSLELVMCPSGVVVLDASFSEHPSVRLEVSSDRERGFVTTGDYGVSLVGEFPELSDLPEETWGPLEAVVDCLEQDPSLPIAHGRVEPTGRWVVPGDRPGAGNASTGVNPAEDQSPPIPWRLLAAIVLGAFVILPRMRSLSGSRLRTAGHLVGIPLLALAVGSLLFPLSIYHQNGHGPLWPLFGRPRGAHGYGAGYDEVFAWASSLFEIAPETAIYAVQTILTAFWPMWVWLALRVVGANRWVAWIGVGLVILAPSLGRLGHSESYYATVLSLSLPAIAVMTVAARAELQRHQFVAATLCASLLISQAVRIHPVGWFACVLAPLVFVVGHGTVASRLLRATFAGAVIALVCSAQLFPLRELEKSSPDHLNWVLLREHWTFLRFLSVVFVFYVLRRCFPVRPTAGGESTKVHTRSGLWILRWTVVICVVVACVAALRALGVNEDMERLWSRIALLTAFVAVVWTLASPRRRAESGSATSRPGGLLLATGAVLLWSLVIRFGLTQSNLLMDGGTGWGRLVFGNNGGYIGMASFLDLVHPGRIPWDIWAVVPIMKTLAALTPPLIVLLARELDLSPRTGFLAGLVVACLPLHAALFSSDFIIGAATSFLLVGLISVSFGLRNGRVSPMVAGLTILAFVCWLRPEGPIVVGPLLALLWFRRSQFPTSAFVMAGLGWLGIHALLAGTIHHPGTQDMRGGARFTAVLDFLAHHAFSTTSLSWFALLVAVGLVLIVKRKPRATVVVITGILFGITPLAIVMGKDQAGEYLEWFRYPTWALPFIAIAAGIALDELCARLSHRFKVLRAGERGPARATALLTLTLALIPLLHYPYLQRQYTHVVEEPLLREAFSLVPPGCGIVVPEDDPTGEGTHEVLHRYQNVLLDEMGGDIWLTDRLHGVVSFTEHLMTDGELISSIQNKAPNASEERAIDCWYFLEAAYCHYALWDTPLAACGQLLAHTEHELVASWAYEYIHHRQVVFPFRRDYRYHPDVGVALYRLIGPTEPSLR